MIQNRIVLHISLITFVAPSAFIHCSLQHTAIHARADSMPSVANAYSISSSDKMGAQNNSGSNSPRELSGNPAQQLQEFSKSPLRRKPEFAKMVNERAAANTANRRKIFSGSRSTSALTLNAAAMASPGLRTRATGFLVPALGKEFAETITKRAQDNKLRRKNSVNNMQATPTDTQAQPQKTEIPEFPRMRQVVSHLDPKAIAAVVQAAPSGISFTQNNFFGTAHAAGAQGAAGIPGAMPQQTITINTASLPTQPPVITQPARCCTIL